MALCLLTRAAFEPFFFSLSILNVFLCVTCVAPCVCCSRTHSQHKTLSGNIMMGGPQLASSCSSSVHEMPASCPPLSLARGVSAQRRELAQPAIMLPRTSRCAPKATRGGPTDNSWRRSASRNSKSTSHLHLHKGN
jgi:hypothetical protein